MCHIGVMQPDKYGQYWTNYDNSRQNWTEIDISIVGAVTVCLVSPACLASPMAETCISGAKNGFGKTQNALKRPTIALCGL